MTTPADPLALADWRRAVAEMYADVRRAAVADPVRAWEDFRARRDALFKSHPQTPLNPEQRARFTGLDYYPYEPAWRVTGALDKNVEQETFSLDLPAEGLLRYARVACVRFTVGGAPAQLTLFWIEGYGGGLFLPFRDATTGRETYAGGRYMYDSIKGADLGAGVDELVLDFNYAYNPSCAYDDAWVCPLSPWENWLPFAVTAGERVFTR
jgi:uncharacterized protein (DUF1684 family)